MMLIHEPRTTLPVYADQAMANHEAIDYTPENNPTCMEEGVSHFKPLYNGLRNPVNYQQFLGELLGTAMLMFFVGGVSMSHDPHITLITHAAAAAIGIMVIIFMFGSISGAHVNPAVTFGFACVNKFPWIKVPLYIVGQLVGAVLGTLLATAIFDAPASVVLSIPYQGVPKSLIIEIVIAVIFMFLACGVATNAQVTGLYASVAVATSIGMNILIAGPVSGASMNPARSLAPALITGHVKDLWLYLLAPFIGAGLGTGAHYLLTL